MYAPYVTDGVISFELDPPDAAEMARRMAAGGERHPWLMAEEDGRVLGYAYASAFRMRAAYDWAVETTVYLADDAQGRGVGRALCLELLARLAAAGFTQAVAIIALPNDPSVRLHERLGARVATPLPRSMLITGSVRDWERWTGLALPESGEYVFPQGLAPLAVDRETDSGTYWEPNVWMIHPELE